MNNEALEAAPAPTTGQVAAKSIDFAKVDALRRHMLLTVASLCTVLGVSRPTYYSWLKGAPPRDLTAKVVRDTVRKMVGLLADNTWPNPAVFVASQAQRLEMLQEVLKNLDKTPTVEVQ